MTDRVIAAEIVEIDESPAITLNKEIIKRKTT